MRVSLTVRGRRSTAALITLVATVAMLGAAGETHAQVACTADDFGCPPAGATCTISGTWDVDDEGGCGDLDFGARNVTVSGTLRALNSGAGFSIEAASLTLNGGKLRAPGTNDDSGGTISITVTGDFTMQSNPALILVDGDGGGGTVEIVAGGAIRLLAGTVTAKGTHAAASGGSVDLEATGLLDVVATISVEGTGGSDSGGGSIALEGPTSASAAASTPRVRTEAAGPSR